MKTHTALLGLVLLMGALSLNAHAQTTSGRFDLIQAIEKASPGAVIRIPAGEFRTSRQIRIRKPITLRGAGKNKTRLVFTGQGEQLLEDFITIEVSQGSQPVVMEDISFTYQGFSPGNLVVVNSGTAEFNRCSFKGPVYDEEAGGGGAIVFKNNSRGTVRQCDFSENDTGVEVYGTAIAVIEDSRFVSNQRGGVAFFDNSGGRVLNNTCRNNELVGIIVVDDAKPTLVGNTCEGNQWGIAFDERAGGEARNNVCKNNEFVGIEVSDDAKPTLVGNTCEGNKGGGIAFDERAGGEANNNTCNNNGDAGILVTGDAKPTLVGNTCEGNIFLGIAYRERAEGEARNNTCNNNGLNGIQVTHDAKPTLVGNICEGNKRVGVAFEEQAGGEARNNTCKNNGYHGIGVGGDAKPTLMGNICTGNSVGILLLDKSNPRLINNTVRDNREKDIDDIRETR